MGKKLPIFWNIVIFLLYNTSMSTANIYHRLVDRYSDWFQPSSTAGQHAILQSKLAQQPEYRADVPMIKNAWQNGSDEIRDLLQWFFVGSVHGIPAHTEIILQRPCKFISMPGWYFSMRHDITGAHSYFDDMPFYYLRGISLDFDLWADLLELTGEQRLFVQLGGRVNID